MSTEIEKITVGEWDENTYLVYGDKDLVIVDPGDDYERLRLQIDQTGRKPLAILITHGHFDHIGAICPLMNYYDIPFYMHSADKRLLRQANFYRKMSGSKVFIQIPKTDKFLDNCSLLELGELTIEVIHAPGHTNGSVSFKVGNDLICGDLIFEQEEGRTDLPESDPTASKNSIRKLINEFNGCRIHPGHGNSFMVSEIDQSKEL
ncbi:MBL fold metallo-hydrolase [Roseivirga sp. E12]|uniref:MBL fold metallo-hydrolase n=1 Tax=Roseivirga sp. E12 TaxID=2819237 RepID=UPI001ABCD37A|nr:MBL fold metallo-hydrolase [Roseivirga sp. E12]MBO3699762.1 MBL fold metallo-hydrolase [Roseivirga sp. E12]